MCQQLSASLHFEFHVCVPSSSIFSTSYSALLPFYLEVNETKTMKAFIALVLVILAVARGAPQSRCTSQLRANGLSSNFNETIAHAIHSMTVQGLRLFNPRATENNGIPTVNHNLHSADGVKVLMNAPNDQLPSDYFDFTMNMIDKVRSSSQTV